MSERVVLVDAAGAVIGSAEKLEAHRAPGMLHVAFSVVVLNSHGGVLLQRRASEKHHFRGLWSNTCCSHPRPGEPVVAAGERRLAEEMGFTTRLVDIGSFTYRATDPDSGLVEHEVDHVLVGRHAGDPDPDPSEVGAWRWVEFGSLMADVAARPGRYTPWLPQVLDLVDAEL